MKLIDKSVAQLLADFRSPDPTPGGGSASALAGAVGASLLSMVAGLPTARAATDEDAARLQAARAGCTELAERLAALVDRDSDAYELVVAAHRLPKGTDEEKALRGGRIQEALRAAIEAPLDVMRACAAALEHARTIADLGNPGAASDVQVGTGLLGAGLRGAKLNVDVNLDGVKDAAYVAAVRDACARLAG
jgi:formiminotetrahydrofolate cyclodeaminase